MRSMKCCRMTARPVSPRSAALFFFLLLLLSLSSAVSAQETTLRTRSNLVLVPTLVKDSQAAIVYGLQAGDFVVEDNGVS